MLSFLPPVLAGEPLKTGWGEIRVPEKPELAERRELVVEKWPEDGNLAMPVPFPNIVRAWVDGKEAPEFLRWSFNKDATENRVMGGGAKGAGVVHLLTAEESGTKGDGTCVLSALDAKVVGVKAALETHPGNHRIGFWVDGADFVAWDLEAPVAAGKYDIELVYSRAGQAGAEVAVTIGDVVLPVVLETTGTGMSTRCNRSARLCWVRRGSCMPR